MFSPMLDREKVLRIAHLARLELSDEEVTYYQKTLGQTLDYVAQLSELDTDNVSHVRHVPTDVVAFRDDRAIAFKGREHLLDNAPDKVAGCFLLPAIIDRD